MRRDAVTPNSPRDSSVGVVMPRAMKPDWCSKSKVRQTIWRGTWITCVAPGCGIASYYDGQERPWRSSTSASSSTAPRGASVRRNIWPTRWRRSAPRAACRVRRRPRRAAPAAGRARPRAARRHCRQGYGIGDWGHRLDAALAQPDFTVFFDAAATHQRVAALSKAIAAGKHIYSEKPVAPSVAQGRELLGDRAGARVESRRGRGQAQSARAAEDGCGSRNPVSSATSPASSWISAGGCSTALSGRASGQAGITAKAAAAGSPTT